MTCEHRDDAGAWVLGALSDEERERFGAHLGGCEACQREVAELQMVADTLPLAAPQMAPPPELKDRIMSAVRAEAAVVLLSGGDEGRTVPAQVVAPSAPSARASLTTDDDRATLRVRDFPAPPRGRVYQVWLKRPGRPPDPTTALFTTRGGEATVEVPGSVAGVDQVLVTAEPDGGSQEPTRDPVIIASPA
jgi:anti-sigma factor RsiW